jgi:hypothetical protein
MTPAAFRRPGQSRNSRLPSSCAQHGFEFAFTSGKIQPVSGRGREATIKTPLVIAFVAVVLVIVSALAVMNKACKSSQRAWCAPMSSLSHHTKTGRI